MNGSDTPASAPTENDRWPGSTEEPGHRRGRYRYWPVFDAVSIARPDSAFFPVTSVRM